MPPHIKVIFDDFVRMHLKVNPEWKGVMSPLQSVDMMLKVLHEATMEVTGKSLSQFGNETAWV